MEEGGEGRKREGGEEDMEGGRRVGKGKGREMGEDEKEIGRRRSRKEEEKN